MNIRVDKTSLLALIVEPDETRCTAFKNSLSMSERFVRTFAAPSIDDAKRLMKENSNLSYIFLSSELVDAHSTEFVNSIHATDLEKNIKVIAVVIPSSESKRKIIEKAIVVGFDSIIFTPHILETIGEVVDSIIANSKPFGPFSPLAFLIKEIISDIDNIASLESNCEISNMAFKAFKDRLAVLKHLDQKELDSYYEAALDLFINSGSPAKKNKLSYSGASKRVRQIVQQQNTRGKAQEEPL